MTGFLGRMAARASGREAGVTPRVPSRFEGAERAEPVGVDEASTEIAATPPVPVRPAAAPPRAEAVTGTPAETEHRPPPPVRSPGRTAALPPPAPVRDDSPPAPQPADPPSVEDVGPPPARAGEAPPKAVPQSHSAQDLVVVSAAPAVAPATASALVPAAVPTAADTPPREPDVVHVSIGRVDVRATVAPPRPSVPQEKSRQPARASSERLTLQDYLRGQREVR